MRSICFLIVAACLSPCVSAAPVEDPAEALLARTFRIFDKDSSGTCFLVRVAADHDRKGGFAALVTAAHTLEGMKGTECRLVLREQQPDDTYARKETTLIIRDEGKPRWKRHPHQDIAALVVELPAGAAAPQFSFEQLADEAALRSKQNRAGQEVWIAGFPAQLEANEAGWPVLRRGTVATHPLLPLKTAKTFLIDISSFGGDSGAPVAVLPPPADGESPARKTLVVGLIVGMQRQTDKATMPFEERTMHTPLGLGIAVQSPFIRETIELLIRERKAAGSKPVETQPATQTE